MWGKCFNKKGVKGEKRNLTFNTSLKEEHIVLFFSLSELSDVGGCKWDGEKCEILYTDEKEGNISIKLYDGKKEIKFRSWCKECIDPVCFQVFGRCEARKRVGEDYEMTGWSLLGQGEFLKNGEMWLRLTPAELEHQTYPRIKCYLGGVKNENVKLPETPPPLLKYIEDQKTYRDTFKFPRSSFKYISHPRIAVHSGYIPRDLFYLKGGTKSPDEFLKGLLEIGFCGEKVVKWEELKTNKGKFKEYTERIIFSVTHYTQCDILYQPDICGGVRCEYFSKGLLRVLKRGDCEDLAWFCSSILENLQERRLSGDPLLDLCTKVMSGYIITNCLVQGTAPQCRNTTSNLHLVPCPFLSVEKEEELLDEMGVFHMTCILYPRNKWVGGGKMLYTYLTEGELKELSLRRFYCEGTACVGENPDEKLDINESLIDELCSVCLPVGKETKNSSLIYGAEIDVITRFFIKNNLSPKCLTFICSSKHGISPEECHWGYDEFKFIPTKDFPLIDENRCHRDLPTPIEKLPDGFNERLRLFKEKYEKIGFFENRFIIKLSDGGKGDIKSPFNELLRYSGP